MNTNPAPLFAHVTFIGIGLIGSSLARAMKRHGLAGRITACARTDKTLKTVMDLGIADDVSKDPAQAVHNADLVVICTPVSTYGAIAQTIGRALKPGAIVSDVGSVKESVIRDITPHLGKDVHLVPAHPIAGTEHSGPESGFAELFENHWCILTPTKETDAEATSRVEQLWQRVGMMTEIMDAAHHDRVLAITSHLPHLIAFTIVGTATQLEEDTRREVIKFSAGGFRDFTRIAASDPVMWRDVFLTNKDAVLEILGRFSEDLTAMQRAIRRGEGDVLQDLFTRTREIRRGVIEARQDKPDIKTDE